MQNITVTMGGRSLELPEGTVVGTLAPSQPPPGLPYLAALVNNDLVSLSYPLTVNCDVVFLTAESAHGRLVCSKSLCFIAGKAAHDLFPEARFAVEHAFGPGLYCSFRGKNAEEDGISPEQLSALEARMRELVEADAAIERRKVSFTDAVRQFEESGLPEKVQLLKYRNPPRVVIYSCDGFADLAHGPLVPSAGVLCTFSLVAYEGGFVILLPDADNPLKLADFEDQPHLFAVFREHKKWGRILGVRTAGRLNEIVSNGEFEDFVRTAEALHDKKLARIADLISEDAARIRVVLVAGPSCAGKTTFAKRLSTHLRVNGIRPVTLGTDDYFVGDERNPRGADGRPDYEHVEAVDIELFNADLNALIEGREIRVPRFNFNRKAREYADDTLAIGQDQMVIVEGIHGLNPRLTHLVPREATFRVYVNALTQLNVDAHNRVSTTDNRLMRRIVRDNRYRGHPALQTLRMWPSVLRGERRWIFPFEREADATFNSALDYELAVIKPLVEPLLMQVKPHDPEYAEARRLTEFLLNFLGAPPFRVPADSILREYIGGSTFRY
ncbi:MAG: nucleoside kinase [Lentisphaerae bacterium]|nr:nucleoside kinase [Lentisphaerota bacterium]